MFDTSQAPSVESLAVLVGVDPAGLDGFARVDHLVAVEAHLAWLESVRLRAVLAVAGGVPSRDDEGREEVAAAIRLSPGAAQRRIDLARALAGRLPVTWAALQTGRVSFWHALAVAETTADLDPGLAAAVEARVFPRAQAQTVGELRAALRRAVARLAPSSHAQQCERAAAGREVRLYPGPDGMATVWAVLPAVDAQTVHLALDALARTDPRGGVPVGAKRADALVGLCAAALTGPGAPTEQGRPVSVQLVVDLPTLLGMAEHPAELPGYGPIPAPLARALAADATWRRLVTDPVTGHLLDHGRTSYQPPQALRDYLTARDRTCLFPGCPRRAQACDADHTLPWEAGGTTSAGNLRMLCRRHHRRRPTTTGSSGPDPTARSPGPAPPATATTNHPNPPSPDPRAQTGSGSAAHAGAPRHSTGVSGTHRRRGSLPQGRTSLARRADLYPAF